MFIEPVKQQITPEAKENRTTLTLNVTAEVHERPAHASPHIVISSTEDEGDLGVQPLPSEPQPKAPVAAVTPIIIKP